MDERKLIDDICKAFGDKAEGLTVGERAEMLFSEGKVEEALVVLGEATLNGDADAHNKIGEF